MAIQALIRNILQKWMMRHVKGHQDTDPFKILNGWAKHNVKVELIAKAYWEETYDTPLQLRQQRLFGEGWIVWTEN